MLADGDRQREALIDTARLAAQARALEGRRRDALIIDPVAKVFGGPKATHALAALNATPTVALVALRARWLDEWIASHASSLRGVVALGVGFDARPLRISVPELHWIEVDFPELFAEKSKGLEQLGQSYPRTEIAGSILDDEVLAQALEPAKMSDGAGWCVLLEGVVGYLSQVQVHQVFQRFADWSPQATVLFDVPSAAPPPGAAEILPPFLTLRADVGELFEQWELEDRFRAEKDTWASQRRELEGGAGLYVARLRG